MPKESYLLFKLFVILIFVNGLQVKAQSYQFRRLSVDDGLSQSAIFASYQDREGYLWFGTLDGLNRYDGHSFEIFRNHPDDTSSIGNNKIFSLTECPKGNLWIGTAAGISVYNSELRSFNNYKIPDERKGANMVNEMHPVGDSLLMIGTNKGLYLLRFSDNQFETRKMQTLLNELKNERISSIITIKEEIWITTGKNLYIYNTRDHQFDINKADVIAVEEPKELLIDREKRVWILSSDYISQVLTSGELLFTHKFSGTSGNRRQAIVDQGDHIWFAVEGLSMLDKKDYTIKTFTHDEKDPTSLSSNNITTLCVSKNDMIWVGTPGLGINQYDPKAQRLSLIGSNEMLIPKFIRAVFTRDDQKIYISTNKGIEWFDAVNRKFHTIRNQKGELLQSTEFFLDLSQYVLAGGGHSLYLMPLSGDAIEIIIGRKVWTALEWKGDIYIGASGGVYRISQSTLDEMSLGNQNFTPPTLQKLAAYELGSINQLIAVDDHLWLMTNGGIKILDGDAIVDFKDFYPHIDFPQASHNTRSAYRQADGTIWFASANNGVIAMDWEGESVLQFDERHGLANSNVYGIMEDQEGDLWVSTNNGISEFKIAENRFLNYSNIEGLQSREFNSGAYFKSHAGTMYFGGVKGLNFFQPGNIIVREPPQTTRITSFLINHEEILASKSSLLNRSIDKTDTLQLDYNQNSFEFHFANINFRDAHSNNYQYRLIGFEEGWINALKHNSASYTNIAPGIYEFQARAVNSIGDVPQQGYASLVIIISEPFWRSAPFRFILATLIVLMLISAVFYMIYRNKVLESIVKERTSEIEKQKKLLVERNRELSESLQELQKTQAMLVHSEKMASLGTLAAGLGHEINNPLNFIKGGLGLLGRKFEDKDKETESFIGMIESGVRRITRLISSVQKLGESRLGEKKPCEVKELIEGTLDILGNQMSDKVIISKNFDSESLFVKGYDGELQQAFHQIFSNAEQSINQEGKIHVETSKEGAFARIQITDSGEGIAANDRQRVWDPFFTTKEPGKGEGLGLPIAYSVIKNHRGSISLQSRIGEGTSVTIKLPLSKI